MVSTTFSGICVSCGAAKMPMPTTTSTTSKPTVAKMPTMHLRMKRTARMVFPEWRRSAARFGPGSKRDDVQIISDAWKVEP